MVWHVGLLPWPAPSTSTAEGGLGEGIFSETFHTSFMCKTTDMALDADTRQRSGY
jgi:hypothetical protein